MLSVSQTVQIQRFANALYGLQVGASTLAVVEREVSQADGSLSTVFNAYFERSFASLTPALLAARITDHLGIAPSGSTIARDYILGQINNTPVAERGAKVAQMLELYSTLTTDAVFGASATAWNAEVAAATAYVGAESIVVGVGRTINVDINDQEVTGTVFDDVFKKTGSDTGLFGIRPAIYSDRFDGLAGQDRLELVLQSTSANATLKPSVSLLSTSIETLQISSKSVSDSAAPGGQLGLAGMRLDAALTTDVSHWENRGSNTDLVIEHVRIRDDQLTEDITLTMRDTAAGDVDFEVYFEPETLRNHLLTGSQIRLEVMDLDAAAQGSDPLRDSPYGAFFVMVTDKTTGQSRLQSISSREISNAQTYAQLALAFQNAVDKALGINMVAVSIGSDFHVVYERTGQLLTGQQINLQAVGSIELSMPSPNTGWLATEIVPGGTYHTNFFAKNKSSTQFISSPIVLDNVGQGGIAGDLVVGSRNDGNLTESRGIDSFQIEIQGNSKLQTISSTQGALRQVKFFNDVEYDPLQPSAGSESFGSLAVLGKPSGSAPSPALPTSTDTYGLTDVKIIDGSLMRGDLQFSANITQASIAKYLDINDILTFQAYDQGFSFAYSGGYGHDVMRIRLDSAVTSSKPLEGERDEFVITANGNEGNDDITVVLDTPNGDSNAINAWYAQQSNLQGNSSKLLKDIWTPSQVNILGGAGDDIIHKPGWGDVYIDAGVGNDTVYSDNSGTGRSVWAAGHNAQIPLELSTQSPTHGGISNLTGVAAYNSALFLYGGKLTVTLSEPGIAAANQFQNGWEVTVDIPYADASRFTVTQAQINQAIVQAINNDPVLSKLLKAQSVPNGSLSVTSLMDGQFTADDLRIEVAAPKLLSTVPFSEQAAILSGFAKYTANPAASWSDALAAEAVSITNINARSGMAAGADVFANLGKRSTAQTDNLIHVGPGDDVVVLSTSETANEIVAAITPYYFQNGQNPTLLKTSIVNFDDSSGSGQDHIDLRKLLLAATPTDKPSRIATTVELSSGKTAPNSVHVLTGLNFNDVNPFSGLTAERLLAALNQSNTGAMDYAGIAENSFDAQNQVATNIRSCSAVVFIENDDNLGEYWSFQLIFDNSPANTQGDYTNVQLIGLFDFGSSVNFLTPGLFL